MISFFSASSLLREMPPSPNPIAALTTPGYFSRSLAGLGSYITTLSQCGYSLIMNVFLSGCRSTDHSCHYYAFVFLCMRGQMAQFVLFHPCYGSYHIFLCLVWLITSLWHSRTIREHCSMKVLKIHTLFCLHKGFVYILQNSIWILVFSEEILEIVFNYNTNFCH